MKVYSDYNDIFEMLEMSGWTKEDTLGVYRLDKSLGEGIMRILNVDEKLAFVDLDCMYDETSLFVESEDRLGIQITFIGDNNVEYYKDETSIEKTAFGTFFYVNNSCVPWVKKYPGGDRVKALTLFIGDDFLKDNGIDLSIREWNSIARGVNSRNASIPQIATVLNQIRYSDLTDDMFVHYLKAKAIEAFILLWDYSKGQETSLGRISAKSYTAVRDALNILLKNFVSPPVIIELAKTVGVDKKTLQSAFKDIVGLSIHKYVRALKMQQALTLMKQKNMTIENIAKEVGYNSKIHFYRAFENVFAMKPSRMKALISPKNQPLIPR